MLMREYLPGIDYHKPSALERNLNQEYQESNMLASALFATSGTISSLLSLLVDEPLVSGLYCIGGGLMYLNAFLLTGRGQRCVDKLKGFARKRMLK